MQKFLIIQTAFIGDVVLATALVEKLGMYFPDAQIDFLLRKGNESLLSNNPHLNEVLIWNKKENKYGNFFSILKKIRKNKYGRVINLQRYFSTGFLTAFSGARQTIGFDKNPLSFLFSKKIKHIISKVAPYKHEVQRNNDLIKEFTDDEFTKTKLYPSSADENAVSNYIGSTFITMSPSSVWFTKQYPIERWIELIDAIPETTKIYLLGGKENIAECDLIISKIKRKQINNLSGQLSFLQSAALMRSAIMNYVNDSAPLHFASGVNAPVTAIFCSTIPAFGFTPLSDVSVIAEIDYKLYCRSCGLHGRKSCPEKHFKCAYDIRLEKLLAPLNRSADAAI
ncbi:MAG: glycosyltransferase family 9 protein [Ferruginibacter sp.]